MKNHRLLPLVAIVVIFAPVRVIAADIKVIANGSVKAVKVVGGNPVLLDSATDAVRKWKFEAAPEETTETVRISFEPR